MTAPRNRNDEPAATTSERAAEEARADLSQLHHDLVEAENRVVETHAAQLVEANEHLVVASLRAQSDAASSAKELKEVARTTDIDPLTQLPNRARLLVRFAHAMANVQLNGTHLAVLFLDLDDFKQINDTLGHAIGDEALKLTASCLASSVRTGDTVSRHGGDEFVILLAELATASDAVLVAEKVVASLRVPCRVEEHVLRLAASIGISIFPGDGDDAETLIDRADAAMYVAKQHRRGSFVLHGQEPDRTNQPDRGRCAS